MRTNAELSNAWSALDRDNSPLVGSSSECLEGDGESLTEDWMRGRDGVAPRVHKYQRRLKSFQHGLIEGPSKLWRVTHAIDLSSTQ
jgi:hypothetical protein